MRILLIPNTKTSALGVIATYIKRNWDHKYCPARVDIEITQKVDYRLTKMYDILLPMYFLDAYQIEKIANRKKIITGMHSHYIWDNGQTTPNQDVDPPADLIKKLKKFKGMNVVSKRLYNIFSKQMDVTYTRCGYDPDIYYPEKKADSEKIVIGWVGNSDPNYHKNGKGFSDFIAPLTKLLDSNKFEFKFADLNKEVIPQQKMRNYYNSIDVLLVAAREEGQPMPPVEAAGCAVPTISTNVGIIPELIKNGESGFIVDRNLNSFINILNNITKEELSKMGQQALIQAEEWKWRKVIHQWIDFIRGNI